MDDGPAREALHEEKIAAEAEFGGGDGDEENGNGDDASPAAAAASEEEAAAVEAPQPTFVESLESVRGNGEPYNWLLAEI